MAVGRGLAILVILCAVATADDRPWAAGVSPADQKTALALYEQGNKLVEDARCKEAIALFSKALEKWDHPAIRYNAALCLIKIDKLVEAYDHLQLALRYGDAPFGPELHRQALGHKAQLESQLAEVAVHCDEAEAKVTLDGTPLLACPGKASRFVLPGTHQIVRTKPRFETETKQLVLAGGARESIVLSRMKSSNRREVRRWPVWIPWVVMGAGAAVGITGVFPYTSARDDIAAYDKFVDDNCRPSMTCFDTDPTVRAMIDKHDAAERREVIAYSLWAFGGALAATGVVLALMNQNRVVAVAPAVGADRSAGLTISGRW
jgi:hypothetical protein